MAEQDKGPSHNIAQVVDRSSQKYKGRHLRACLFFVYIFSLQ